MPIDDVPTQPLVCVVCGRTSAEGEALVTWAGERDTRSDTLERLCPGCAREHVRSIEAKLDPRWW